jgi:hypothetical protein
MSKSEKSEKAADKRVRRAMRKNSSGYGRGNVSGDAGEERRARYPAKAAQRAAKAQREKQEGRPVLRGPAASLVAMAALLSTPPAPTGGES